MQCCSEDFVFTAARFCSGHYLKDKSIAAVGRM